MHRAEHEYIEEMNRFDKFSDDFHSGKFAYEINYWEKYQKEKKDIINALSELYPMKTIDWDGSCIYKDSEISEADVNIMTVTDDMIEFDFYFRKINTALLVNVYSILVNYNVLFIFDDGNTISNASILVLMEKLIKSPQLIMLIERSNIK
ncbi:hypothetical protein FS815_17115 [Agrobacterium vitis]|uniref:hypothetical protein n=1 Tax=Allorhizobium ampelinum TaxID=3025782 RepID=UPI001F2F51BF|nr:hypothetical protein [Allorhizobium ampelinum]MCF1448541.1 hypothetical protein [Allorhizobium ampelinum]